MQDAPKITRRQALAVAAPLFLTVPLRSQSAQEQGRQLVQKALQALGGEAFLNLHDQVASGRAYSFYNASVRGLARITVYDRFEPMRPDAPADWLPVSRREVYTEKGDYYSLFRNGKGWEVTYQGARPLPADVMEKYRLGVQRDFLYFLRYRRDEKGLYYYSPGMEIVDNVPTDVIEITDYDGETIKVYVRQSDGLPHMGLYTRRDPKTRIPYEEKTIWSKYKPSGDGATLPWNIRKERDGEEIYEQFAGEMKVNQNFENDVFDLPRGVKELPPDV
ncbi:MAG: hypothetical protein GC160_16885 [Acidobacteria bacterium]|nr:hypothetical protein [Acidobacteriota bacterium]